VVLPPPMEIAEANTENDSAWTSTQPTGNILFGEYDNTNAAGTRVSWSKQLSSAVEISMILSTYSSWVDGAYLGLSAS